MEIKQIFQNLNNGKTEIISVPCPMIKPGHFLIETRLSLISTGTEGMLVDFGKANLLEKARSQPEKVKQVLDKISTDGLFETLDAVMTKLNQPIPLGYSNVGIIREIPKDLENSGFHIGDRVVSNGPHADLIVVPRNLCAKIPDEVSDEEAAFCVLGSIALQGIRLANPTIGETFVVSGLGVIGLLTVQILIANGCKVIGIDYDETRIAMARSFGALGINLSKNEDPLEFSKNITNGYGVDGVIISAATKSSDPVQQAARMCRQRGRIILVGVTGLELNRSDFYNKELTFQVSCSYGPGRYDSSYENKGQDYPFGLVRWTENRNFEAILDLIKNKKIEVENLISHRWPLDEASKAYDMIFSKSEKFLGILIKYSEKNFSQNKLNDLRTITLSVSPKELKVKKGIPVIGLIGAGNFTGRILLPAVTKTKALLKTIVSEQGVSGTHLGKKCGFQQSSTDMETIFSDEEINTVFITTRHNTHADLIIKALECGKNIFVEKPLCLNVSELKNIIKKYNECIKSNKNVSIMVGFNRRFSPFAKKIKELLETDSQPKSFIMTVNAGFIPKDSWIQNLNLGGGRIIGEACHFIDLLRYLASFPIKSVYAKTLGSSEYSDTTTIEIEFENGSIGTIHYFTNGAKSYPKERLEVFGSGKILALDNFRKLTGYGWKNFKSLSTWRQDKGHTQELKEYIDALTNSKPAPIDFNEIIETTWSSFAVLHSINEFNTVNLKDFISKNS